MSTKKKSTFTEEFKHDAVSLIQREGSPFKEAASRLGIHPSVLGKWKRRIEKEGEAVSSPLPGVSEEEKEELRRLRAENRRLQLERDLLKKAPAFFAKESL